METLEDLLKKQKELGPHTPFVGSTHVWDKRATALWESARARHAGRIKLIAKRENRAWLVFWTIINWVVWVFTFGKGFNMVDGPYTTLGPLIFLPGDGLDFANMAPRHRYSLLSHEIAHVDHMFFMDPDAQDKTAEPLPTWKYVLMYLWVCLFGIAYALLPLPYFYAKFRAWVEYHGYKRNLYTYIVNSVASNAVDMLYQNYIELSDKTVSSLSDWDEARYMMSLYIIDGIKGYKGSDTELGHKEWYRQQFTGWNYGKMLTEGSFEKLYDSMLDECLLKVLRDEYDKKAVTEVADFIYSERNFVGTPHYSEFLSIVFEQESIKGKQ